MLCRNAIILFVLTASSCNGFWWGTGDTREVEQQQQQQQQHHHQQQQPIIKQVPSVSYFRTYTYQPVTFAAAAQHRTGNANPYQYQTPQKYPFINNPLNNWPQKQLSSSSQSSSAPTPSPQMTPSISSSSPSSTSSSASQNPSPQLNDYHVSSYQQHSSYQQSQPPQQQSSSQLSAQYPQSTLSASQLYNQQQPLQSQPQIQEQQQQQPLSPSLQSLLNSQQLYNSGQPQQYSIPSNNNNNNNNNNDYFAPIPSTPIQHYSQSSTYINPITMGSSSSLPYKQNEFSYDPVNLQYFTNIAPFTVQHVQFVPCMCPVTLNIAGGGSSSSLGNGISSSASSSSTSPSASQDIIANKRTDEILLSQPMQVESRDGEKSEEH